MATKIDLGKVTGEPGPQGLQGIQGPQGVRGRSCMPLAQSEPVSSPAGSGYWREIVFASGGTSAPRDGWMRLELLYKAEFDVHVWVKDANSDIVLMLHAHSYEWGGLVRARLCFPVPEGCRVEVEKTNGTDFSAFSGTGVFNYCRED